MNGARAPWALLLLACGLTGCAGVGADRRMANVPPGLFAPTGTPTARAKPPGSGSAATASRGGLFAAPATPARPVATAVSPTVASFFPGLAPRTAPAALGSANAGPRASAPNRPGGNPLATMTPPPPSLGQSDTPSRKPGSWLAFRPIFASRTTTTTAAIAPSTSPKLSSVPNSEPETLLPVALNVEVHPVLHDEPTTRLVSHEMLLPITTPTASRLVAPSSNAPPPLVEASVTAPVRPATVPATRSDPAANPVRPAVALGSDAPPITGGFGPMQLFPNSYYERAPAPASVAAPKPKPKPKPKPGTAAPAAGSAARRVWRSWSEWSRLSRGQGVEVPQGG